MNRVEERLEEDKRRINELKAPPELEGRLRDVLNHSHKPRRFPVMWKIAMVAVVLFIMIGYHYNALAFYGKKILGFDEIMSGTLQQFNEEGRGQIIDKTYPFGEGAELTIDGVMTDANRMIVYYTLSDLEGDIDHISEQLFHPRKVTGLFTNVRYEGGQGLVNEAGTELKGSMDFAPPSPFSKTLTLHFWENRNNGQVNEEKISFSYDPNQAMQTKIKQKIHKTVQVDKGTIDFDSIVATPTLTVIEDSLDVDNFDRLSLGLHGIELLANGLPIELKGSGSSSSFTGTKFDLRFDALPKELDSLSIYIKKFVGYKTLDAAINIGNIDHVTTTLDGEEIWIKQVSSRSDQVEITIVTDEFLLLDDVSIGKDQDRTELTTTIHQNYSKQENGGILKERTLLFETSTQPDQLFIGGVHYMKDYNQFIEVPVD